MNTTQKHIIVAGAPRSGKTTLCSYLAHSPKYQHLAMDTIILGIEEAFPESSAKHTKHSDFLLTDKKWLKFVKSISSTGSYDKLPYRLVFDMYYITPKEYIENVDSSCCDIIFLGYPNISIEEKCKQIRNCDSIYDWTSEKEDAVLENYIRDYIKVSQYLEEECKKYDLPFIDVSHNREKILKDLSNKILKTGHISII